MLRLHGRGSAMAHDGATERQGLILRSARLPGRRCRISAWRQGREVGSALLGRRLPDVELTDLMVAQEDRGRGYGRALVRAAAEHGARHGARALVLTSQDDGSRSLDDWYRRMGFGDHGRDGSGRLRLSAPVGLL